MSPRTITAGRPATPERWQQAVLRARKKNIQVRRLYAAPDPDGGEDWVATSGSDPTRAYAMRVRDGIVVSCGCEAATVFGDAVCCHRAAWYVQAGTLVVPAPAEETPAS